MEVSVPSGFLIDNDRLLDLLNKPHVKRADMKNGETSADIYIDQMVPNQKICLQFQGYRSIKVAENKPVLVRTYDYYDSCKYLKIPTTFCSFLKATILRIFPNILARYARAFYEIPSITSCQICEGEECSQSCKKSKTPKKPKKSKTIA